MVVALVWGLQLHLVEIYGIVVLSTAELRIVWSTPVHGVSYFAANVTIAASLAAVALAGMRRRRADPRTTVDRIILAATLVFAVGFGYRLLALHTRILDDAWFETAVATEGTRVSRVHLGVITSGPGVSPATITLDSCEQIRLPVPVERRGDVVVVEVERGAFSGLERVSVTRLVEYDDLCSFVSANLPELRRLDCLLDRCRIPVTPRVD